MQNNIRFKIAPPWITYVNEITALFQHDPDIELKYNNDDPSITIFIKNNPEKAAALCLLLPDVKIFGNISLFINIEADEISNRAFPDAKNLFDVAFDRNPVYAFSKQISNIFSNKLLYVVFKNKVVQFFNDNLNDIFFFFCTLYQTIAQEIFNDANLLGVYYCTDVEEKVGKPLGEWP